MKTLKYLTSTSLLLTSVSWAAGNITGNKTMSELSIEPTEQQIVSVVHTMTNAFHQADIETVMSSYESNVAIMFEPGTAISDLEQIQAIFKQWFTMKPQFTYPNGHQVFVAGDIAMHIAPWDMSATGPEGSEIKQSGLSIAVLRKQENGKWLMVLDNPHGQMLLNAESIQAD